MPRMGALEREETKSLILVCRARGYNHKQILSAVTQYTAAQYHTKNKG